uniref:Uncharacterized protein n=1 Tax=Plectus sambesii TaxID=2011161 RepID=A0A914X224_9BILA
MGLITACIIAAVALGIAQGNLLLPRGNFGTLTAATPVNKSEVCNIETFRTCAHQYFQHYGFKPQPISENAFQNAYEKNEVDNDVDGFKNACGWIKTFEECTVPSSCWTPNSIAQLGFNASDARGLFYMYWNSAYLCTTGYNSVIEHFDCMWNSAYHTIHHEKMYKCITEAMSINDPSAELCW